MLVGSIFFLQVLLVIVVGLSVRKDLLCVFVRGRFGSARRDLLCEEGHEIKF